MTGGVPLKRLQR